MVLKPQDVLLACKCRLLPQPATQAELSHALKISASEINAAIHRCIQARLAQVIDGAFRVNRQNLLELLVHGLQYVFPPDRGPETRGLSTGVSAPILRGRFASGKVSVWPDPVGKERGEAFSPLYPSVPYAAKMDPALYGVLALADVLRGGTARERTVAIGVLQKVLP